MSPEKIIDIAACIGSQTLSSGGDVSRVEDTIIRICKAYDAKKIDVFSVTLAIFISVSTADGKTATRVCRINNCSTDFDKLNKLNKLSREICECCPSYDEVLLKLSQITNQKCQSLITLCSIYMLISVSFAFFFGACITDAIISTVIGAAICIFTRLLNRINLNILFLTLINSTLGGLLAAIMITTGIGHVYTDIIIGNVMILIPGVMFTTSIRDMVSGDFMTGIMRLTESIVIAVCVAVGFSVPTLIFKGMTI